MPKITKKTGQANFPKKKTTDKIVKLPDKQIYRESKTVQVIDRFITKYGTYISIVLIFIVSVIIFKDFLFLKKVFFFKDIGSDTVNVDYPLQCLNQLMDSNYYNTWSFYFGMGYPYVDGFSINIEHYVMKIVIFISNLISGNDIAYSYFLQVFFQIILCAYLFLAYLRTIKVNQFTSIIFSLIFAFLGFTILGSGWGYQRNVIFAVMLLFSFEQLYKYNRWYFMPFAVIYMSDLYYCFLFGFFLLIYSLVRYIDDKGKLGKEYFILLTKTFFLGILGFLMNLVNSLPGIMQVFNSPRVSGNVTYFKTGSGDQLNLISGFEKITAVLRTFSSDILGNGANYKGWYNYLEAPLFYCGLFTILIFAQVFVSADRNRKILFAIFSLFWICVAFISPLRYAILLYAGNYYKIGINIFVSFMFIYLAIYALERIIKENKINNYLLFGTLVVILIALYYPYSINLNGQSIPVQINKPIRNLAAIFLICYALLIYLFNFPTPRIYAKFGIFLIVLIELTVFSSKTINSRITYRTDEYKSNHFGYKDNTIDALNSIKESDKGFYRVEKDYSSGNSMHGSLNDAMAQGYYGTTCYSSFNQKYYIRFLEEIGIIKKGEETQTRWAPGLRSRPLLQTIACVKYNLSKSEKPFMLNAGYSLKSKTGDVSLMKNDYFLPLGFTYDSCISFSEFKKLSNLQKDVALLRNFVIEDNSSLKITFPEISSKDTIGNFNFEYYQNYTNRLKKDTLLITSFNQNEIEGTINISKEKMLFFSIPYDAGWRATDNGKPVNIELINIGFCGIELASGNHQIVMKYIPPYFTESMIVSGIAFLFFILGIIFTIIKNKKKAI